MIPFVVNDWMWRTGVGGSIPSMIAYVLGVAGIFRLLGFAAGRQSAYLGAAIYGLNPNLLYMQATAMTESIFLAAMIWAVLYLYEFVRALGSYGKDFSVEVPPDRSLEKCALCLAAAILTRYDGWILAAAAGSIAASCWWAWKRRIADRNMLRRVSRALVNFVLLCALVPTLWLAQNYALSARPLDFANGPYSAKAIEARSTKLGDPPHPGTGSLTTSAIFFLKAAKLNVSDGILEPIFFLLALAGTVYALCAWRYFGVLLLLWLPLPFYAYSVAYGSVPIFMPMWWPHSYYNVRYGLELLPAFAVFIGLLPAVLVRYVPRARWALGFVICAMVAASYCMVAWRIPICLREARVNGQTRIALEARLAGILRQLPPQSTILMQTGEYVGALQSAGIPLRRVIWEGVHPEWDNALADPAHYGDYVVAVQGNEVWYATRLFPSELEVFDEFDPPGKPHVTVYRSTAIQR